MLIAILVATLLIGYPVIANADITFTSGPKGGKNYLVAKKYLRFFRMSDI